MKFTESQLEQVFISFLEAQGYPHVKGEDIVRGKEEVLIREDLRDFLQERYTAERITSSEISGIIRELEKLPASDLYETNKTIMNWVRDGFLLKRENHQHKHIFISLIDYEHPKNNIFKIVNQLEIQGFESLRIPDGILYINGLPLVVFEFKSSVREEARLHSAYVQLTNRYRRDIPDLFKYNAFCIIGDGVNTKAGSLFAPYEFFYAWRKIAGLDQEIDPQTGLSTKVHGIDSMYTLIRGMLDKHRLCDIIHNFIYLPDSSKKEEKILCRYPQYYAATKLFKNIKKHQMPHGDGKGGTYFGATGCGKSFTMLYLTRLLMKSLDFASPTIVLITDRTDLDDQLSTQFTAAKDFIGDNVIKSVGSRADLRAELKGRNSGGVFLTTIHKFNEDTELLTERSNVICISDEAHRSQTNLDQKVRVTEKGVKKSFGFAKHLHDSLPNATYVGFTGTPIDATMDVFGEIVDTYTMTESVMDEITVRIVYEGRAAKVLLENQKLQEIEDYYSMVADSGGNEYQVDESKRQMTQMRTILGDPGRIEAIAKDFVQHYETRVHEGSTLLGKAMFVCSTREIAYQLYQEIVNLRPAWADILAAEEGVELTEKDRKELKPMARVNMVMTRTKDDEKDLWDALGTQDYRKELDRQFKYAKSNFKIAIVVDMWLTGFDVPFLDTMYIDKPLQEHSLIQTISRVNRKFEGKSRAW